MTGEIALIAQATTSPTWVDTPVLSSVSESDAGRLADLLSTQSVQSAAPSSVAAARPVTGTSIGDSILRAMDNAGKSYVEKSGEIEKFISVEGRQLTTTDLLRIQFQLINSSLQVDLLSKAISKAVQHVDQMTKLQ